MKTKLASWALCASACCAYARLPARSDRRPRWVRDRQRLPRLQRLTCSPLLGRRYFGGTARAHGRILAGEFGNATVAALLARHPANANTGICPIIGSTGTRVLICHSPGYAASGTLATTSAGNTLTGAFPDPSTGPAPVA